MTYKQVLAGSFSLAALLGGVAIIGIAPTSAAENTTVSVEIGEECVVGAGSNTSFESALGVTLSTSTPSGEDASSSTLDVTCNTGWTLTEVVDNAALRLGGTGAAGFTAWTSGTTVADFAVNTWGMKYSGTAVTAGNTNYHAVPTTAATIASGSSTAKASVGATFGAKTDGSVAEGTYSAVITYTLAGV